MVIIESKVAAERWDELLATAAEGQEVVLMEGSRPIARLLPLRTSRQLRIPGLHRGRVWVSEDFDDPLPEGFWSDER